MLREPIREPTRPWLPYAALVGAALVWALHFVVARAFRESLPPFSFAFWRWTIALAALLPFVAGPLRRARGGPA